MEVGAFYSEQTHVQIHPHPLHTFSNRAWNTSRDDRQRVFGDEGLLFASTRDQDGGNISTRLTFTLFLIDEKLYHKRVGNCQGYTPLLDTNIDPSNRGDLLEGFAAGWEELIPEENDETSRNDDRPKAGTNVWPLEPAGFREAYLNY